MAETKTKSRAEIARENSERTEASQPFEKDSFLKSALKFVFNSCVNLIILFVLYQGFNYAFTFGYNIFNELPADPTNETAVIVEIPQDSSSKEIINLVLDSGVVRDKYQFIIKTYLGSYYKKFQPGSYEVNRSMTDTEILDMITGVDRTAY